MKFSLRLLLASISIGFIIACVRNTPEPGVSVIPANDSVLSDSINILDSIVNSIKVSNHKLAFIYSKRALSLALTLNSKEELARSFLMIGVAYKNFDDDSSFICQKEALKIADKNHLNGIKPKIYYNLAILYRTASDLKMAAICLDSSIIISQNVNDYAWLSNGYNALGNLKFKLHETVDAKAMFDSAFNIATRHNLSKQTGIALASLARFEPDRLISTGMRKEAIEILKKKPGSEEEIALILNNLGNRSSNPDTAIRYFESAIKIARSANSSEAEISSFNNMAYSFMDKMDFKNAEACLKQNAIPLAQRNNSFDWLSTLYDTYSDVLAARHDSGQALIYEHKALKNRVEADSAQASGQVRLLSALLNVKNKELKIQTNAKELQQKENKIHLMNFWYALSSAFVLLLVSIIIWYMLITKIRYKNDLLKSAKRLIESEENLKGRVSMELHDLTTPFYITMQQQIDEAKIGDAKIENELKNKLSKMHESIRQISHQMNNSFLKQLTLSEQVKGLCEDLKDISSVPIQCVIRQQDFHLSPEETIHIYRIIQELLTNGIKYVTFGEIKISLSEQAGYFAVIYQDTGPGFDMNIEKNTGFGVRIIIERAKIINGKAILKTAPGQGTKWNISIPLNPKKQ